MQQLFSYFPTRLGLDTTLAAIIVSVLVSKQRDIQGWFYILHMYLHHAILLNILTYLDLRIDDSLAINRFEFLSLCGWG